MLNKMERRAIRLMWEDKGVPQEALAQIYHVSQATISRIVNGETLFVEDELADRMEAFGLVTVDDGCYRKGILSDTHNNEHEYVTPNNAVDWCTPEAELEAEQTILEELERHGDTIDT